MFGLIIFLRSINGIDGQTPVLKKVTHCLIKNIENYQAFIIISSVIIQRCKSIMIFSKINLHYFYN